MSTDLRQLAEETADKINRGTFDGVFDCEEAIEAERKRWMAVVVLAALEQAVKDERERLAATVAPGMTDEVRQYVDATLVKVQSLALKTLCMVMDSEDFTRDPMNRTRATVADAICEIERLAGPIPEEPTT